MSPAMSAIDCCSAASTRTNTAGVPLTSETTSSSTNPSRISATSPSVTMVPSSCVMSGMPSNSSPMLRFATVCSITPPDSVRSSPNVRLREARCTASDTWEMERSLRRSSSSPSSIAISRSRVPLSVTSETDGSSSSSLRTASAASRSSFSSATGDETARVIASMVSRASLHLRPFRVQRREVLDGVNRVPYAAQDGVRLGEGRHLDAYQAPSLGGGGHDPLDAGETDDGLFDAAIDVLVHLLRRRTRRAHRHVDGPQIDLREVLHREPEPGRDSARDEDRHEQIGGDRIRCEVADQPLPRRGRGLCRPPGVGGGHAHGPFSSTTAPRPSLRPPAPRGLPAAPRRPRPRPASNARTTQPAAVRPTVSGANALSRPSRDHPDAVALLQGGFRQHVHVLVDRSRYGDLHERARRGQRVRVRILRELQEYRRQAGPRSDHRGNARHPGLPGRHLSGDAGRTADHRIQVLEVLQRDRHRHLQRLGPVHDAQAGRRPVDPGPPAPPAHPPRRPRPSPGRRTAGRCSCAPDAARPASGRLAPA